MSQPHLDPAAARLRERLRWRLIAAAATPLSSDRAVDRQVLHRYLNGLVADRADGLAVLAHTGRGPFLDGSTREAVIATAVATGVPVVVGVTGPGDAESAARLGAAGLLVFAPPPGPGVAPERGAGTAPDRGVGTAPDRGARRPDPVAVHDAIWCASGLPMIAFDLYSNPYPATLLAELLAHPGVAALKVARLDDAVACQAGIAACTAAGRLAVTGEDRMFGASLLWGAQAALVGIAAAAVPASAGVLRAFAERRYPEFVAGSARLDRFAAATFAEPVDGYVQRMLWIAAAEGRIPAGFATDHFGPELGPDDRDHTLRALKQVSGTGADRGRAA
ncbi:dihydrodipicolinate synthase family protein [Rugosimonospora africana]|uniref:4-hydroxy-tetrahydrodipicolinate synthase n=1 Tax=Rugosimonospora africana TaxID=556532 RepID=A0A8J3VVA4_9ACTN|nr:dihydrodipicolinate synthase family protein [Rugosimonospora africana]GIH19734.1 hypothetical protein Raf01_79060 [Rugosimonospora africana]